MHRSKFRAPQGGFAPTAPQGGFAMILVLCLGALFVALSAALVFAASTLAANANRQLLQQEVYALASTFSDRLDTDLTTYDGNTQDATFAAYANTFLHGQFYEEVKKEISFSWPNSEQELVPGGADKLTVTLNRDEPQSETDLTKGVEIKFADSKDLQKNVEAREKQGVMDYTLIVSVTAQKKDDSFTYAQTYNCYAFYQLYYTLGTGTATYTYTGGKFEPQTPGNPSVTLEQAAATGKVTMHYDADDVIKHTFENRAKVNPATAPPTLPTEDAP